MNQSPFFKSHSIARPPKFGPEPHLEFADENGYKNGFD
jgi:hypothetical protein